jgi:hypothetical protein
VEHRPCSSARRLELAGCSVQQWLFWARLPTPKQAYLCTQFSANNLSTLKRATQLQSIVHIASKIEVQACIYCIDQAKQ